MNNLAKTSEVYICGGGVHNSYLMDGLKTDIRKGKVMTTSVLGIEPDWVEAITFAWLAKQSIKRKKLETAPFTGAIKPCVLGGIYFSD